MKHFTSIITFTLFGLLAFSAPAFAASAFSFAPASASVKSGDTVTLRISLDPQGVKNYTAKAEINFPADLLEATDFTFADKWLPLTQAGFDAVDNAGGVLVKTAGYPAGASGPVLFGTISFLAKKAGSGTIKQGANSLVLDASGQNVLSGGAQTAITITAPGEVSEEPGVEAPVKTAPPEVKKPAKKKPAKTISPARVDTGASGRVRGEEAAGTREIITVPSEEFAAPEATTTGPEAAAVQAPAGEVSIRSVLSFGTNKTWVAFLGGVVMAALVLGNIRYWMRMRRRRK